MKSLPKYYTYYASEIHNNKLYLPEQTAVQRSGNMMFRISMLS